MAMIGGGPGAFIGAVHRMAAAMDGHIDLVAGVFSRDFSRTLETGRALFMDENRLYRSYEDMLIKESLRPESERVDLISVVTPNNMHYGPSKMALECGFHVICDKPLCFSLEEAYSLKDAVINSGKIFALTHNYTGYPMVKQARDMVRKNELGSIRKVVVEYAQGWLSSLLEATHQKQASWRTDPSQSGIAGSVGDIGTHAFQLMEYMCDMRVSAICADVSTLVKGRLLDDDVNILLRFPQGARGILHASQVCAGEENNLRIRIYGEKGSLDWSQMEPNTLIYRRVDATQLVYRTGSFGLGNQAMGHTRLPAGHPEGYLEAFACIYRNVAKSIQASWTQEEGDDMFMDFPTIDDGVRGMEFIYKVIESGKSEKKWLKLT
jgi:predicted dehydrogenase